MFILLFGYAYCSKQFAYRIYDSTFASNYPSKVLWGGTNLQGYIFSPFYDADINSLRVVNETVDDAFD